MLIGWNDLYTLFFLAVFKKLSGDQAVLQMAVYLLANLVGIGLGVYKVNAMGLLPTSQSDWLEFMVAREVSEGGREKLDPVFVLCRVVSGIVVFCL